MCSSASEALGCAWDADRCVSSSRFTSLSLDASGSQCAYTDRGIHVQRRVSGQCPFLAANEADEYCRVGPPRHISPPCDGS